MFKSIMFTLLLYNMNKTSYRVLHIETYLDGNKETVLI